MASNVRVRILSPNARGVAIAIRKTQLWAHESIAKSVLMHGQLLKTRIQANASGRPGPNAPTGDYRRSWNLEAFLGGNAPAVVVGTNKPQGRRLEYGFTGMDSLGRYYDQPPYPHVGPAYEYIEPLFLKDLDKIIKKALS